MPRIYLSEIPVDIFPEEEILGRIEGFAGKSVPCHVVTINSIIFNLALKDEVLKKILRGCRLSVPDSAGIVFACRFLAGVPARRLPGIDLMMKMLKIAQEKHFGVFLLGSSAEVARKTAEKIQNLYPGIRISGFADGYFRPEEEKNTVEKIRKSGADILFVALNVPRQEKWINANLVDLNVPVVMGVGGSFDVISGKLKRAPLFMQKMSLEWLFRVFQEPWRISRIKDLPLFVINVFKLKFFP